MKHCIFAKNYLLNSAQRYRKIMSYFKNTFYCLSMFFLLSLAGCKEPEPELPELPPTIVVSGQNPLKTAIYASFVDDSVKITAFYGLDSVWTEHTIDTSLLGYYQITYHAQSLSGMMAETQHRNVWVVVKPESMKGLWEVIPDTSSTKTFSPFIDSLTVVDKKLIVNNLNNISELKTELSLAADLQDSVYIFEQYISDSLYCVFGFGTIDERAMTMTLHYSIIENNDTTKYQATYSRKTTPSATNVQQKIITK